MLFSYIQIVSIDYLYRQLLIPQAMMSSEKDQLGILQVFKIRTPKAFKHLPIIFSVKFQRHGKTSYVNYDRIRKENPYILIQFFEKRVRFHDNNDEQAQVHEPVYPALQDRYIQVQDLYGQLKKSEQQIDRLPKFKKSRNETKKQSYSMDHRPIRSCRLRNQLSKGKPLIRQNYQMKEGSISRENQSSQVQQANEGQQNMELILDYDYFLQEKSCVNLISPAVIPDTKIKQDSQNPMGNPFQSIPRYNFKDLKANEREHESSQEFKQSEQSEFILDQRGKEKRKKEKLILREQERLMNRKKKSRRIKKKPKNSKN